MPVYAVATVEAAQAALLAFEQNDWSKRYLPITTSWHRDWDRVIPFFAFPPAIRKIIYITNAIESINAQLRKIIKTRRHPPSNEGATKLLWLVLRNITCKWGSATHDRKAAMNQFEILYEDRFTQPHR